MDYDNMYEQNYRNTATNYIGKPTWMTEEIITLNEAIELIRKSVGNEKEDEIFYDTLIKNAPTAKDKDIIISIRDDEKKHNQILRALYFKFTGETIPEENRNTVNTNFQNATNNLNTMNTQKPPMNNMNMYKMNLEKALFGELEAVKKYRKILGAMPDNESYTLIMSIMTDELRHADKYNYLLAK